MTTKTGVGFSINSNSKQAGVEAAQAAMKTGGLSKVNLAILFSTSKHDPKQLREGVRSVIGPDSRLIGGYAIGIITKDQLGYGGYECGVALFSSDTMKIDMFMEKGLAENEFNTGVALGKQLSAAKFEGDPSVLLMYDSVKMTAAGTAAGNLNLATPLLAGMRESKTRWLPTAGVGMLGDMQFNPTHQWFDQKIEQSSAMALALHGKVRMDTIIIHGCKPSGSYHKITKTDKNAVLEIDNRPALDVIGELLGSEKTWEQYPLFVTLGVNKGDKFAPFKEEDYANRLCMAIDKERKALIMFEDDLKAGSEFQLMRRSINFEYIQGRAEELLKRLGDRKPFFAFYIDCAGRAAAYCGTEREEAAEVQKVIGSKMPLLGMYSGVEVAWVGKDLQALDWTGVLTVFSE